MAVTKELYASPLEETEIHLEIICPICKIKKELAIPKSVISKAKQLSTISVQKHTICRHHFQVFIDKNYVVRGYQKVDYDIRPNLSEYRRSFLSSSHFRESLIQKSMSAKKTQTNSDKMEKLRKLYDEFWEFIDNNNEEFQEFIKNDGRRNISK